MTLGYPNYVAASGVRHDTASFRHVQVLDTNLHIANYYKKSWPHDSGVRDLHMAEPTVIVTFFLANLGDFLLILPNQIGVTMNGSCSRHGRDEFIKNFGWKT
jgi:hypothetical protein